MSLFHGQDLLPKSHTWNFMWSLSFFYFLQKQTIKINRTWNKDVQKVKQKIDIQKKNVHLRNSLLHQTFMAFNVRDIQSNSNMWHTKLNLLLKELKPTLDELLKRHKIWVFLSCKIKLNCALSWTFDNHV